MLQLFFLVSLRSLRKDSEDHHLEVFEVGMRRNWKWESNGKFNTTFGPKRTLKM